MTRIEVFVVVSGTFGMLITVPMFMLAVWSRREAHELRSIQHDLVALMVDSRRLAEEMHELQAEIRSEQHDAVAAAEVAVQAATDAVEGVGVSVGDVSRIVDRLVDETDALALTNEHLTPISP